MDVFEAIKERHSYRGGFKREPIPAEHLRQIVQAGLMAPSGKNMQTTQFVIVDHQDLLCRIGEICPTSKAIMEMQAMVACIVDRDPEPVFAGLSFQTEDCCAAVENMLLAVTALGYRTVWTDGALRMEGRAEAIGALLGVPENKVIRIILPIGKPSEEVERREKLPFEQRAWFNRYGG